MTAPDVTEAPAFDPEAPFGRKEDGTPYKRSKEDRDALTARLAAGRAARANGTRGGATGRGQAAPPRVAGKATPKVPPYQMAVLSLLQLPAMALGIASRFWPVLSLDSLAITVHAPTIAKATDEYAQEEPRLAAVLERVSQLTPGANLGMVMMPVVLQILANHGKVPVVPEMGILSPDDLMREAGIDQNQGPSGGNAGNPTE